jgi:hypothetical protein
MIIIYDINKFFKDKKLVKSHFAKKCGMSKALFGYHLNKGDIKLSQIQIIAEELGMSSDKLIKVLTKDYIKKKI